MWSSIWFINTKPRLILALGPFWSIFFYLGGFVLCVIEFNAWLINIASIPNIRDCSRTFSSLLSFPRKMFHFFGIDNLSSIASHNMHPWNNCSLVLHVKKNLKSILCTSNPLLIRQSMYNNNFFIWDFSLFFEVFLWSLKCGFLAKIYHLSSIYILSKK